MTQWIVGILTVVFVLMATPFVIGRFLSRRFGASAFVELKQSREAVWTAINDFEQFPVSGSMRKHTMRLPDENDLPSWREDIGSSRIRVTTLESHAPSRLVRRFQDESIDMSVRYEYELEPTAEGTRLSCSAEGMIDDRSWQGAMMRFMIHVIGGFRIGQRQYLRGIAKHFDDSAKVRAGAA